MSTSPRAAALPMYGVDRQAVAGFWEGLARAMRAEGVAGVPDDLVWPEDLPSHWRSPELLLSQACGYPLVEGLGEAVQVVGAFHFGVPGAAGHDYSSFLVARADDPAEGLAAFRGRIAAYNSLDSHSGYNALRAAAAPLARDGRFFGGTIRSGAHRRSLDLVRDGAADVAAIDCVTLALLERYEPAALSGLHVVGRTRRAPGLPLITSRSTSPSDLGRLRRAIAAALDDPDLTAAREALFITAFSPLDFVAYARCAAMREAAIGLRYPVLA